MSTLAFINSTLSAPFFKSVGSTLPDRWYLDFICRKDVTKTLPILYGSMGLTGLGVTIFIISSGVKNSPYFGHRLSWLLGEEDFDWNGHGTSMAFLAGASQYGVASHCSLISLNVYDSNGINAQLYQQAVDLILTHGLNIPCIVLTSAIRSPLFGNMVIPEDLDQNTRRLISANFPIVACAGDGLVDKDSGFCLGPILAEVCHPAHFEEVITVSSLAIDLTIPFYANYGYAVDVFAPGHEIITLDKNGQFTDMGSSRLSAAIVSGILALYLEKYPKHKVSQLKAFIKEHSFTSSIAVEYPLDRLQKDPFFDETYGYLTLRSASGFPYQYLVDTQVPFYGAHAFFTKAFLEKSMIHLGAVLANTQFEIPLNTRFKNLYGEFKTTEYTLLSYNPTRIGILQIGRHSGKLFGSIKDILEPVTCVIEISINDGLYLTHESFTLYVQPNYAELQTIGGTIKARLQNIVGLDVHSFSMDDLDINSVNLPPHDVTVNISRDVRLLETSTGRFVSQQNTTWKSGEFLFTVPLGSYRAIVLDDSEQYEPITIDGLKATHS